MPKKGRRTPSERGDWARVLTHGVTFQRLHEQDTETVPCLLCPNRLGVNSGPQLYLRAYVDGKQIPVPAGLVCDDCTTANMDHYSERA